jgi:hypothetical protein
VFSYLDVVGYDTFKSTKRSGKQVHSGLPAAFSWELATQVSEGLTLCRSAEKVLRSECWTQIRLSSDRTGEMMKLCR